MPRFEKNDATCSIVAFKDGMFSRAGHDVKLVAETVVVDVDAGKVTVTVDARSIRPVCAMKDGSEDYTALSAKDLQTIRGTVEKEILAVTRYPEIRFESTSFAAQGNGMVVDGKLTLKGRTRPLRARVERQDDRFVVRVLVRQPEFGIRPFTALLGGLKIKPDVAVEVSIPAVDVV